MTDGSGHRDSVYANPAARDAFLAALDSDDRALSVRLARDLVGCSNALPGLTREALGLPAGATYGAAARYILALEQPREEGRDATLAAAQSHDKR